MNRRTTLDGLGLICLFSVLFTLCTSRPAPGAFFAAQSKIERTETKIDTAKLKAQTALAQYENDFNAAYMDALDQVKKNKINISSMRPERAKIDTLKIEQ
jgi:hypothetical protein